MLCGSGLDFLMYLNVLHSYVSLSPNTVQLCHPYSRDFRNTVMRKQ
jgi:hypothetical protein